jgi:sugar phosphate permease
MAQLGQRIGTAVGVSAVTAVFFGVVLAQRGTGLERYREAFRDGFFVTICLLVLAFVIGLIDLRQRNKEVRRASGN